MHTHLITILLVLLVTHLLTINPSLANEGHFNQPNLLSKIDTLNNEQVKSERKVYPERVTNLVEYFQSKNIDLESLLEKPEFKIYDGIGDRFRKSAERKIGSLEDYLKVLGFNDKKRRIHGFIDTYSESLQEAESTYNIPKYVIAAIIGIESDFGENIGSYNPLNVYVSMYTEDYRADFAQAQLEELLLFTARNDINVFELKSSYAGAMSYGQFIPYSINRWFVGDDIFDMKNNIHSVANYLAHFYEVTGSLEGAVYRYNPSTLYRDAVLTLANEAEQQYEASAE